MNIYDLISRAQKLRKETQLDSVSPDRVGGLHEDTLKYINEFQLLASSPSLHKAYASVSAMQSDKSPKSDLTGKPLKPGQLVVIVPANQTDATAGDVYRYDGPSGNTSAWTFVAKIGAVPADAELSATSTNPPQNKVVTEKLTELESEVIEGTLANNYQKGGSTSFTISAPFGYNISNIVFSQGEVVEIETSKETVFSVYELQDGQIVSLLAKDVSSSKISLYVRNGNGIRVYNEMSGSANTTFTCTQYKMADIIGRVDSKVAEVDSKVGKVINKSIISLNRGSGYNFNEFVYEDDGFAQIDVKALDKFVYSVYEVVDGEFQPLKKDVTANVSVAIRKGNILRIYGEYEESVASNATFEVLQITKQDIVSIIEEKENYLVNSSYLDESYRVSDEQIFVGFALNADGTISQTNSQAYKVTDFIDIKGSLTIKVKNNFCLYDKDKNFIGGVGVWNPSDLTEHEHILPNNAAYFRAQLSSSTIDFSAEYRYTLRKQTSSMKDDVIMMCVNLFDKTLDSNPIIASLNQTETKFLKIPKSADAVVVTGYSRLINTEIFDEHYNKIAVVKDNGTEVSLINQTTISRKDFPLMRYVKRLVSTASSNDFDTLSVLCQYKTDLSKIKENEQNIDKAHTSILGIEQPFVCPEDFEGDTIAEQVANANDFILKSNGRFGLLFGKDATSESPKTYLINKAIVVASNTTIKVVNSTIQMADYVVDNMFRSSNIVVDDENPLGFAKNKQGGETLENIKILGKNAILQMPNNTDKSSIYEVGWRGVTSYIVGVENFEVCGFHVKNNLAWGIAFADCKNGKIHDLDFNTNRGNGDGVSICASHDIAVYNISGITEDDSVALYSLSSERLIVRPFEEEKPVRPFDYDYHPFGEDVYNIYIDNISTQGVNVSGACVDIVEDKHKIHDIFITRLRSGKNKPCALLLWAGYGSQVYRGNVYNIFANDIEEVEPNTYGAIWLRGDAPNNSIINKVKYVTKSVQNDSGINDFASVGFAISNVL